MPKKDVTVITSWWRSLPSDSSFVALPKPTRSRYTQSDGQDDFAELAADENLSAGTSFAFWHWQSHKRAFSRDGALVGPLFVHWGGDHAAVREALGDGPPGFEITDNGPRGAFELTKLTTRDADGLPDPDDVVAVRQFIDELQEPISRRTTNFRYRPLTDAQRDWLLERVRQAADVAEIADYLAVLELREDLPAADAERWGAQWLSDYASDLTTVEGWHSLLHALLRVGSEQAWDAADRLGEQAFHVLAAAPSQRGIDVLREAALGGSEDAVDAWLQARIGLHGEHPTDAAEAIAVELEPRDPATELWEALATELTFQLGERWADDGSAVALPVAVHPMRASLDERLPEGLRAALARKARPFIDSLTELAAELPDDGDVHPGYSVADARADLARFGDRTAELLQVSGPALTGYEGGLVDHWNVYRTLTDGDIAWLHERVADPATELQGLGFCLELLYAHGVGTVDDVDALSKRWRKVLGKSYRTTYTEWRHPLVVLTCLARDLDHPLADKLTTWWEKTPPAWKAALAPMTGLGAPTEGTAAALWDYVVSGESDDGQLQTWVLVRARLDGTEPVLVADELLNRDVPGIRPYVLQRILVAVIDPQQPLWHYGISEKLHWWERIVEVVEHPEVSDRVRQLVLDAAQHHRIITYPDDLRPPLSEETVAQAKAWLAAQLG